LFLFKPILEQAGSVGVVLGERLGCSEVRGGART
jgi:hypothetical protein